MKSRDVEVVINCDGAPLPEYRILEEQSGSSTCFIASQTGKHFEVSIRNMSRNNFEWQLYCDGTLVSRRFGGSGKTATVCGVRVDKQTIKPFLFSTLKLTDDESALTSGNRALDDLGTIKLRFFRCEEVEKYQSAEYDAAVDLKIAPVHEKTKKAGAHAIALGHNVRAISPKQKYRHRTRRIDQENSPYLQLVWCYRPRDLLQAQGIIPAAQLVSNIGPNVRCRTSPGPDHVERPAKRSRTEELSRPQTGSKIKHEGDDEEWTTLLTQKAVIDAKIRDAERRRVKREDSPIRLAKGSVGEVIDLTID